MHDTMAPDAPVAPSATAPATPDAVLTFWREAGPDRWFVKDEAFDAAITDHFRATWEAAAAGSLAGWETAPDSALALVLVADQFPRNMFRGSARAFATDPLALRVAEAAIAAGFDRAVDPAIAKFFYLPFMHAEDVAAQERCVALFTTHPDADSLKYALIHLDVIRRFGRFPHRNAVLGRATTPDEAAFLAAGGFAG